MNEEIEKVPSIGISYTVQIPPAPGSAEPRGLVLQTFVSRDATKTDLDGVLDKLREAADRQYSFAAIEHCVRQVEQEEKTAKSHAERITIVEENHNRRWMASNRKGEMRLSEAEEKERYQAHANLENAKFVLEKVKSELAKHQARVGIGA